MFSKAKNGKIEIGNTDMDYVSFGKGDRCLLMIPGVSDGMKTVKGMAIAFAVMYKRFAKCYRVYVISRKNNLENGYSTREMAADYKTALEKLGISHVDVIGISQGGMIAQYIAIDYPDLVGKLVLAVTLSRQNEIVRSVGSSWIKMAESNDFRGILVDSIEKSYTEKRQKKYKHLYPLLSRIGKQKDLKRFIIQANACISHDAYGELCRIKCSTLVIGAGNDKVVGIDASKEIADNVDNSILKIYEGFGHGLQEEAKEFNKQILEFLSS